MMFAWRTSRILGIGDTAEYDATNHLQGHPNKFIHLHLIGAILEVDPILKVSAPVVGLRPESNPQQIAQVHAPAITRIDFVLRSSP